MTDATSDARIGRSDAALAARLAELEATYDRRIAELEGTVGELTALLGRADTGMDEGAVVAVPWGHEAALRTERTMPSWGIEGPTPSSGVDGPTPFPTANTVAGEDAPDEPTGFDRRRLLSRAGTAAVGAVIGGAAASIAAASPAAAASGTFDGGELTPAITAVNTAGGPVIVATASDPRPHFGDGPALVATTGTGTAIVATSRDDIGVEGKGDLIGVRGRARGWGVFGDSENGTGVLANSRNGIGIAAAGGHANMLLASAFGPRPLPPPEQTVAHSAGEVVLDRNVDLWLCTADGTPGTWVKLNPPASVAGTFVILPAPVRVYDTRPGNPPTGVGPKTPLATHSPRSGISVTANGSGVPTEATAAMVSATVTRTTGGSSAEPAFLSLYASGQWPGTSNLNWTTSGATIAVTTVVPLAQGGTLTAYASNPTDLVLDVLGYYR